MGRRKVKEDEPREEEIEPEIEAETAPEQGEKPRKRRTLAELAADSAPTGGVCCPRCGCGHSIVKETWDVADGRRRKRVCRHCGHVYPTTER